MSKLSFELTRIDVKEKGNFFLVVQLDETEFSSEKKKTQKYRTEIDYETEFPQFFRNYFEFVISTTNKIVIRIGLFKTEINSRNGNETSPTIDSNFLFSKSQLIGSSQLTLTTNLIELLRKHKWIENNLKMKHPEKINLESYSAHIYFKISLKFETLEMKILDHNSEIEKYSNDLFENDQSIIKEKLNHIIILNEEKQYKLDKSSKKLDEINSKLKLISVDKKNILKELSSAVNENTQLQKSISKIENYEEIHIEVELLSNSTQGISMLKKKFAILLSQKSFLSQIKMEFEGQYTQIEPVLSKIKIIKDKTESITSANKELLFNMNRQEDLLPLISAYQNQIKSNEEVIDKLKEDINMARKSNDKTEEYVSSSEEIDDKIALLFEERKRIEEKIMQMKLFKEIYSDKDDEESVRDVFKRIMGGGFDPMLNTILEDCEEEILIQLKEKIEVLKTEENKLSNEISKLNKQNDVDEKKLIDIEFDVDIKFKKDELRLIVDSLRVRETVLEEELENSNLYYENSIRKLKERIENVDRYIYGNSMMEDKKRNRKKWRKNDN